MVESDGQTASPTTGEQSFYVTVGRFLTVGARGVAVPILAILFSTIAILTIAFLVADVPVWVTATVPSVLSAVLFAVAIYCILQEYRPRP